MYYINNILSALGAGGSWDATKGLTVTTPVATKLAITGAPSNSIAVGQQQAFGLTDNGQAVTSGVTWSVDKAGAVVDQNGNFIASAPGTYTVTASYEGQTATAEVVVYGQAAAVKLSVPSSLVANKYPQVQLQLLWLTQMVTQLRTLPVVLHYTLIHITMLLRLCLPPIPHLHTAMVR